MNQAVHQTKLFDEETTPTDTLSDRREMLQRMRHAADTFYGFALRIGVHTFVEFAGFLNEYVKMCQIMLDKGVDFTQNDLKAQPHNMAYVAEKIDCIFGAALNDETNRAAFLNTLSGLGGWDTEKR